MKKALILFLFSGILFADCCPQTCDPSVERAFKILKKSVNEAYNKNITELKQIEAEYDNLITQENMANYSLTQYIKRLKIEYFEMKKTEFNTNKNIKLEVLKK